ncbi:MAG: Flp pilus assembly protein CpaB [Deltaproteobacteria bacterium]|nr:MAG: Flp pilus assembly protein CpaB [Deltaproteobacteria bacterium]
MLKGKAPIIIALVLGFLAAIVAYRTLKRQEERVREGWNLVPVVVANRNITEGTVLEWDMVAQRDMPEQFVTPSVVAPNQIEKVIGQPLMVPLQRGDLILWSHFRSEGTFERLSNIVNKQARAVTLNIEGDSSVGGWVRPNDIVDIIGVFRDPKTEQPIAVTIMQSVLVLATGKITGNTNVALLDESAKSYSQITFMVLPEEAEMLVLASRLGKLHLTLRNPEDISEMEEHHSTDLQTLLTGTRAKELKNIRDRTFRIIRLRASGGGAR